MLVTKGITKRFGHRTVVNAVNLEIKQGEVVGLLGPNGAGKTTTFNMIVGLLTPNDGDIFLDEENITNQPMYKRARKGIAFLCQEPSVFRQLRVDQNLIAIYEILGFNKEESRTRSDELLEYFNLKHVKEQKAYTLSGGERRRVEIARALINQPKFLLLDEPFTGIDPISRAELQELILGLKKKGIGILISDHNVRETLEITDRAYLIYDAKVLFSGDAQTLISDKNARKLYLGEKFRI
jgi:lipopolysaccharide export system ATP-binding protein